MAWIVWGICEPWIWRCRLVVSYSFSVNSGRSDVHLFLLVCQIIPAKKFDWRSWKCCILVYCSLPCKYFHVRYIWLPVVHKGRVIRIWAVKLVRIIPPYVFPTLYECVSCQLVSRLLMKLFSITVLGDTVFTMLSCSAVDDLWSPIFCRAWIPTRMVGKTLSVFRLVADPGWKDAPDFQH